MAKVYRFIKNHPAKPEGLTPDKEIKVNGTLNIGDKNYFSSAVEIVDRWRDAYSN